MLGEDLVLFRYDGDKYGLVHKHCPHRRASLEYGKCEPRGIRCCYHGWLFAADGEILETPGEAPDAEAAAKVRARTRLGRLSGDRVQRADLRLSGPAGPDPGVSDL